MKKLTSNQIRKMWLDFFIKKDHHKKDSFSLIPESDPTLLWINSGIAPLKKYFNGSKKIFFKKIVNIQKCLRTNDIENIGKTSIHHTFFEMLGNFSIGDYFKKEAINLAYELLFSNEWFSLPKEKIYITYFDKDIETYSFWLQKGISEKKLIPLKTNFWEIGEGPCGPCTEIFFDRGSNYDSRNEELIYQGIKNNRFIEIWNIVFSQYNCINNDSNNKKFLELPNKNIDTGAGLERLACIFQQTNSNFETDLFFPIIKKISNLSNIKYENQESFKIIADHIKSLVFCINDGAIFSNNSRGYVLKKILRNALLKGQKLNFKNPFLFLLIPSVINIMKTFYPSLKEKQNIIQKIIKKEEQKFFNNLKNGKKIFFKFVENNKISGKNFFKLYDTYGIPKENILEYADKYKIQIDKNEFDFFLDKQKQISKKNYKKTKCNIQKENPLFLDFKEKSEFIGYEQFEVKTKIIKIFEQGIVLEKTPFYAIMGGQISDEGTIDDIPVHKVIKLPNGQFLHQIKKNIFQENQEVFAKIDIKKRKEISSNHTATHLLYESLRNILGFHVEQKGSSLNSNILRFDFNHYQNLSFENLKKIEKQLNKWIKEKHPVIIKKISKKNLSNLNNKFFNNKFFLKEENDFSDEKKIRLVKINDISSQLCGGTHISNTQELKIFSIISYEVIGAGIHRIEGAVGHNIEKMLKKKIEPFISEKQQLLKKIKNLIKNFLPQQQTSENIFNDNIFFTPNSYDCIQNYKKYLQKLREKLGEIQKKVQKIKINKIIEKSNDFIPQKIDKELLIIIEKKEKDIDHKMLKVLIEHLFNKLNINFLCICLKEENNFSFLCKSKENNIKSFLEKINNQINIKGGGNKNFCQGKIINLKQIDEFISKWKTFL
jgi:alanyl-tRNA synthetase